MTASHNPAVSIRRVSKWYGSNHVLKDASLDIGEGEVVSLLGPSGSGKSTLLRTVAGFIQPTSGTVLLRGRDATHMPPQKRNTAMVFQNYALFPHKTVFDNLAFGLRMRKLPGRVIAEKVENALALIQLSGYGTRLPKQLSGGEQQRVALMRALITEPDVLLMDEPLGALDRKLREEMQVEIKSVIARTQTTTLYVTHDQEEALVLSDRVVVMRNGVIEQIDSPTRLYGEPQTPFVARFVGVSNVLPARVVGAAGGVLDVATDRGMIVRGRGAAAVGDAVHVVLRPERLRLRPIDDPAAAPNAIAGAIAQARFLGLSTQYVVETNEGHHLIVTELNADQRDRLLESGTAVRVECDVDVPRILDERVAAKQNPAPVGAAVPSGLAG